MKPLIVIGWIISIAGTLLWLYGYFFAGNPSYIAWQAHSPWWVADFLPNIESEVGMMLIYVGMIAIYWPFSKKKT